MAYLESIDVKKRRMCCTSRAASVADESSCLSKAPASLSANERTHKEGASLSVLQTGRDIEKEAKHEKPARLLRKKKWSTAHYLSSV